MNKKLFFFLGCFYSSSQLMAEVGEDMAFDMRSSGKIYVVVGVIVLLFVGLLAYLIYTDLKIKKLEKLFEDKK